MNNYIEKMNVIDALNDQICALLDLMQMAEGCVDIKSVNVAAEMCATMLNEMKVEIDGLFDEVKDLRCVAQ